MQLRDSKSSALIYEGTPLACAVIAKEIGLNRILFDGAPVGFDPKTVIAAQNAEIDSTQAVIDSPSVDADGKALASDRKKGLLGEIDAAKAEVDAAASTLDDVRSALG